MIPDGERQLALYSVKCGTDGEGDPETGETGVAFDRQSNRVNSDHEPTASGLCYVRTIGLKNDNGEDELYCRQRRKSGLAKVGDDRDGLEGV